MTLFAAVSSLATAALTSDVSVETAVFFSALLATGNALCALVLSHIGMTRRSMRVFLGAVLGGMLFRMAATLIGFVVGLKILLLPASALAVALLTYTALFIAAEVSLWSRRDFSTRVQAS
jgi:hypothetical protein